MTSPEGEGNVQGPSLTRYNTEPAIATRLPDVDKANDLLVSVKALLSSDFFGNLYIKGAKTTNDPRHRALSLVFRLVNVLETYIAYMEKQSAMRESETSTETKKPGKANGNLIATINNVVDARLEGLLRDASIKIDRLEGELQAVKQGMKEILVQMDKMMKRATHEQPKGPSTDVVELGRKLKASDAKHTKAAERLEAQIAKEVVRAQEQERANHVRHDDLETRHEGLESRHNALELRHDVLRESHTDLTGYHNALDDSHNDTVERHNALSDYADMVVKWAGDKFEEITKDKDSKEDLSSWE